MTLDIKKMKVTVSRKAHFNAAHKLFRSDWSDEKNIKVFGKCANENYHGHNYELIVSLTGEINKETGYVYDLGKLKNIIKDEVEEYLDHKNWNVEKVEIPTHYSKTWFFPGFVEEDRTNRGGNNNF